MKRVSKLCMLGALVFPLAVAFTGHSSGNTSGRPERDPRRPPILRPGGPPVVILPVPSVPDG